jgi:ring-1,2-phenylacetyl-CoA epoxidase subunit PaaB
VKAWDDGAWVREAALAHAAQASATRPKEARGMSTDVKSNAACTNEWPLWEVFVRPKAGLDHKHCGSLHAPTRMAVQMAREVYTRRQEGTSVWVVRSEPHRRQRPGDKDMYFDPMEDKVYRHPTFYKLPDSVDHM